jgi:hypothetical protein
MTPGTGETPAMSIDLDSANGSSVFESPTGVAPTFTWRALASSLRRAGDVYTIDAYVTATGYAREELASMETPANTAIALPAGMTGVTVSVVSTTQPYVRLGATWDAYAGAQAYVFRAFQGSTDWHAHIITTGWLAGTNGYQMPNLSSLPGWDSRFPLATGTGVSVQVTAQQTTGTVGSLLGARTAGTISKNAAVYKSITP